MEEEEERKLDPSIVHFLGNIVDKGTICTLQDAEATENSLIVGKICTQFPLVPKSKYQNNFTLVYHLKEIFSSEAASRKEFRVVFIGDIAEQVNMLALNRRDYLVICNAKLTKDWRFNEKDDLYHKLIVFDPLPSFNKPENLHYKRRTARYWLPAKNFSSHEAAIFEDTQPSQSTDLNYRNMSERDTGASMDNSLRTAVTNTKGAKRNERYLPLDVRRKDGVKSCLPSAPINSKNGTSLIQNLVGDISDRSKYSYVKLNHLTKDIKVNIYAVITKILKKPTVTANNKLHTIINVIDETKSDEFFVHVFYKETEQPPVLQPYFIVRLHRLRIEEYQNRLDGRIFSSNDIVTFERDDTTIVHKQSENFSFTDSDQKRVDELKEWMLENIASSRPYTLLKQLQLKRQKINMRCEITVVKYFPERNPVVVLRVRDSTVCKVPFFRLKLDLDNWTSILTDSKACYSETEEIDIIVAEPETNFRKLEVGQKIELYNVVTILCSDIVKTKSNSFIKFNLVGLWDNVKILNNATNITSEINDNAARTTSSTESSPNTKDKEKKRKLFNPNTVEENMIEDEVEIFEDIGLCQTSRTAGKNPRLAACSPIATSAKPGNDKDSPSKDTSDKSEENPNKRKIDVPDTIVNNNKSPNVNDSKKCKTHSCLTSVEKILKEKSRERIQNVFPDNMANIMKSSKDIINNDSSKENDIQNYITKWPEELSNKAFDIQVHLLMTNPIIDATTSDSDVMSIVSSYCTECFRFFPYYNVRWVQTEDENPIAICPQCKEEGRIREISFLLMCELLLKDQSGGVMSAVILGGYAEKFFGCSVSELCSSSEIKLKIKNLIDSYLYRVYKEQKPLLVRIIPFHIDSHKYKYHITKIVPFGLV